MENLRATDGTSNLSRLAAIVLGLFLAAAVGILADAPSQFSFTVLAMGVALSAAGWINQRRIRTNTVNRPVPSAQPLMQNPNH